MRRDFAPFATAAALCGGSADRVRARHKSPSPRAGARKPRHAPF
jgi:hypothetical protein